MINLSHVLAFIGYDKEMEQLAYIKLMAYRNCFSKPQTTKSIQESSTETHHRKLIDIALPIWQQTGLQESYPENIVITDEQAKLFLQTQFSSVEEGFLWLFNICELKFLRKTFFDEGIGLAKEETGINHKRWQDTPDIVTQDQDTIQLASYFKTLGLNKSNILSSWPDNQPIVLFSHLESILKERMEYLPKFTGKLYCLTGPRGLFNFEPSVAAILAQWFHNPDYEAIIQQVLAQHLDDEYQWCRNLSGLKQLILNAIGEHTWPAATTSAYYEHKDIYDQAARAAQREPLDCCGGPWPVALDLIRHLRKDIDSRRIVGVVALGKDGRLTGIADEVDTWYQLHGKQILAEGQNPLFIASNSIHATLNVQYNLLHNQRCQESLTRMKLMSMSAQFPLMAPFEAVSQTQFTVCGPGSDECRIQDGYDALAKILFTIRSNLKPLLTEYQDSVTYQEMSLRLARRMIVANQFKNYFNLTMATFGLANTFYLNQDYIKAVGLLHFAMNVIRYVTPEDNLIDQLQNCAIESTQAFINYSCNQLLIPSPPFDSYQLKARLNQNKTALINIRRQIEKEFEQLCLNDSIATRMLYANIFEEMKGFLITLIQQANLPYNRTADCYAFLALGSYSRKQQTPFSDLESCILIDGQANSFVFAHELAKLLLIYILHLGETVLPSLNIVLNDGKNSVSLVGTLFDHYTPQGLSFDRGEAGITPLGKTTGGRVLFRLMADPEIMASHLAGLKGYQKNLLLPQILRTQQFIYGNKQLYNQYETCIKQSNFSIGAYSEMLLRYDSAVSTEIIHKNRQKLVAKQAFYRPVYTLIENLSMHLNVQQEDAYAKIELLAERHIISTKQKQQLQQCLVWMQYIRLQQHFKFKEQKTEMHNDDLLYPVLRQLQKNILSLYQDFMDRLATHENARLYRENSLSSFSFFKAVNAPALRFSSPEEFNLM